MLTGASGFLGIHVLERLLDEGNRVRALVRTPAKLRAGFKTGWSWLPHSIEGSKVLALNTRIDASAATNDLGIVGRSLEESMRDTVRWLAEAGHIPPRAAGRCIQTAPADRGVG